MARRRILQSSQAPTITAGAYAAGDAVGGLLTFEGLTDFDEAFTDDYDLVITKAVLIDKDNEKAALNLILFDRLFTPTADNSPWPTTSPTEAEVVTGCQGHILFDTGDYAAGNSLAIATVKPNLPMKTVDGNFYGQLVAVATPTYGATTDLVVILFTEFLFNK